MGRLEDIEKRMEKLAAEKKAILAKNNARQRKRDTRAKVIAGSLVLKHYPQGLPKLLDLASERDKAFMLEWANDKGMNIGSMNQASKDSK